MAVFTNTMPTQAYRSSGRPEVTYAIERLIDTAAVELGFDRVELRRKNLDRAGGHAVPQRRRHDLRQRPLRRKHGLGDGDRRLARLRARKREAARRAASSSGCGLANYVEVIDRRAERSRPASTCGPKAGSTWSIGTQPSGQGHETSFAQVVADLIVGAGRDREDHRRRHRHRESRRRLAFRSLDAPCGDRVLQGRGRSDRTRQASRRRHSRQARRTRSNSTTAGSRRATPTARSTSFELAREAAQHTLPDDLKDGHRGRHRQRDARAGVSERLRDLRGRGRSRHRRRRGSPATRRSTTSAAASIR